MIPILLEASIRAFVVALLVGLLLGALRPRSAALRHAAWTMVLLAMLVSPLVTLWRPQLPVALPSLPIVQSPETAEHTPEPSPTSIQAAAPAGYLVSSARSTATSAPSTVRTDARPVVSLSWRGVVLTVWFAGVVVGLVHLAAGWRCIRRLAATCVRIDHRTLRRITATPVAQSRLVASPVVFGIRRPHIVLPASWETWSDDDLHAIVGHEAAHVARRDAVVSLLARVNRVAFWFHPLAWWLEPKIAACAEHACDDAVVRQTGDRRPYAELLVQLAAVVHARGERVAWRAIGITGRGRLEARIDRILAGEALKPASRIRAGVVALGCLVAVTAGMACQQQPPELRPDPDLAADYARREERIRDWQAAASMSAAQAADLEVLAAANPSDLESTVALLTFYQRRGQELFGWNDMIERRRPHQLRLIQHRPEAHEAGLRIIHAHDPEGYAQARALWVAHVARPDVSSAVLANAASFFGVSEKPLAEELLLRARAADPGGPQPRTSDGVYYPPWADRLGALYAQAIVGANDATEGNVVRGIDPDAARGSYAVSVRAKLDATDDVAVLVAAGRYLTVNARGVDRLQTLGFEVATLGRSYLERALRIDPSSIPARRALINDDVSRRRVRNHMLLFGGDSDNVIAALPEAERFEVFADAVEWAHSRSRMAEGGFGGELPAEAAARVRRYAEEAVALADKLRVDPNYSTVVYRAHLTLGALAIRDGDRARAVEHLRAAGDVPGSEELALMSTGLPLLVHALLDAGERESVAAFLDRLADINRVDADRWRGDARSIREGRMPPTYQLAKRRGVVVP